jgi:hypothetical protein
LDQQNRTWLEKIPKPLKKWLAAVTSVLAFIFAIGCVDKRFAWGALLSLSRGELAMLYMMSTGLSRLEAVLFVVFWSTLNIYNCCWCGDQVESIVKKAVRNVAAKLRRAFNITAVSRNKNETAAPASGRPSKFRAIAEKFPYFMLPLYCFDPIFGISSGVVFAKSLPKKLNMKIALIIFMATNLAEKTIWSFFLYAMMPYVYHVVVPIVFFALGIVVATGILRLVYFNDGNHSPS